MVHYIVDIYNMMFCSFSREKEEGDDDGNAIGLLSTARSMRGRETRGRRGRRKECLCVHARCHKSSPHHPSMSIYPPNYVSIFSKVLATLQYGLVLFHLMQPYKKNLNPKPQILQLPLNWFNVFASLNMTTSPLQYELWSLLLQPHMNTLINVFTFFC